MPRTSSPLLSSAPSSDRCPRRTALRSVKSPECPELGCQGDLKVRLLAGLCWSAESEESQGTTVCRSAPIEGRTSQFEGWPGWARRPFSRREVQLLMFRAPHAPASACIDLGLTTPRSYGTVDEVEVLGDLTRGRVDTASARLCVLGLGNCKAQCQHGTASGATAPSHLRWSRERGPSWIDEPLLTRGFTGRARNFN